MEKISSTLLGILLSACISIAQDIPNDHIERIFYDYQGNPYGVSLEAAGTKEGYRVVFVSLIGDNWIEDDQLRNYVNVGGCIDRIIDETPEDGVSLNAWRIILIYSGRKTLRHCLCDIDAVIVQAIFNLTKI